MSEQRTRLTRGSFAYPGTTLSYPTGTWRVQRPVHAHRPAPCHAACPAGEDPQAYIAELDLGHTQRAWETLVRANPLPGITGRVCPHPCESGCNRGHYDAPLAIHSIERFLGDQAIEQGWAYPLATPPATAPRAAVIGAGPAGLSASYHLLRLGVRPTLFTALSEAGGTLHSIPGYRLPRAVVSAEVERVLATGIDFRPGHRLGRDMHIAELQDEFGAVFIATGTQRSRDWSVEGVVPRDLHVGLNVLKEWMSVGSVPEARSVAVVGGGNTAVDLARVLKRAGVAEVHLITHESIPKPGVNAQDAMRAIPREIEQAIEEGVLIHEHRGIRRLLLRGEKVTGLELVHMKKLAGADGTLRRVPFEGTETVLHVDQVIPAIGQVVNPLGLETLLDGRHFLEVGTDGSLPGHPGLYAGGDVCGPSRGTVTAAVGDGRRAAETIAAMLLGHERHAEDHGTPVAYSEINTHYFEPKPRAEAPILAVEERIGEAEIEGTLSNGELAGEARRCFSCGNCMACDNCWTLCPDSAVLKTKEVADDGSHYVFDYTYCKGCGLCAHECPCGYIDMQPEP